MKQLFVALALIAFFAEANVERPLPHAEMFNRGELVNDGEVITLKKIGDDVIKLPKGGVAKHERYEAQFRIVKLIKGTLHTVPQSQPTVWLVFTKYDTLHKGDRVPDFKAGDKLRILVSQKAVVSGAKTLLHIHTRNEVRAEAYGVAESDH